MSCGGGHGSEVGEGARVNLHVVAASRPSNVSIGVNSFELSHAIVALTTSEAELFSSCFEHNKWSLILQLNDFFSRSCL